ncbi:MAG TPA: glycosyltransferase [Acidimicrobiales bacterium]|nr:glycosyltransferase [Acidimicrobiales bacterium]
MTVVLCTRDRAGLLGDALDAIATAVRPGDEVLVIDSASRDSDATEPARHRDVPVLRAERPGLSVARNVGLGAATTPVVAFTDDDCRPRAGWAAALAGGFVDPAVGFVTGFVEADRQGRMAVSCMVDGQAHRYRLGDDPFHLGVGANMAVRTTAAVAVGGFDERLGAGAPLRAGEDVDLWWRLLHAGWEGRYAPDAQVTHVQWRSDGQALRLSYGYGLGAGALAAKAIRAHQPGGWGLLRQRLWTDGLRRAAADLADGYQTGAAACLLQAAGSAIGATRAALWRG